MTQSTEELADAAYEEPIVSPAVRMRVLVGVLIVLCGAYALQVLSPLRLNTDAVTLLRMSDSFRAGEGFTVDHARTQFPVGYPFCMAVLEQLGIARGSTFILFNLICLAGAMVFFARVAQREYGHTREIALLVIALTLGSFSMVKHITLPLTEPLYMLLSMLALDQLSIWQRGNRGQWWHMATAALIIAASILTRMIGIALLPAAGWAILQHFKSKRIQLSKPAMIGTIAVFAVALIEAIWMISHSKYIITFNSLHDNPGHYMQFTMVLRFIDSVQLALNMPGSVISATIPAYCIGAAAILFVCLGIQPPAKWNVVDLYVYGYCAIMFVWPYQDPRFWNPVMPMLFLMAGVAITRICGAGYIRLGVVTFYCVCYAATSIGAFVYSTKLTFAGTEFANLYGVDAIHASYQAAFGQPVTEGAKPDPAVERILREYEPLAKTVTPTPSTTGGR